MKKKDMVSPLWGVIPIRMDLNDTNKQLILRTGREKTVSFYIKDYCQQFLVNQGPSWSSSYGSWIYNYLCDQCLSPLTLQFRLMVMCTRYKRYFDGIIFLRMDLVL
jgi:hypothetical protein